MEFFNEQTQHFHCPCEGCDRKFKGLTTLSNHFNKAHPRADKPPSIYDTIIRQAKAKTKAKIAKKAINVNGTDYQSFKSAKWAEIKASNPTMSFEDINKTVSQLWKEAKAAAKPIPTKSASPKPKSEPVTVSEVKPEPVKPTPKPFSFWVDAVADCIADMMIEQAVAEMEAEPEPIVVIETIEEVSSPAPEIVSMFNECIKAIPQEARAMCRKRIVSLKEQSNDAYNAHYAVYYNQKQFSTNEEWKAETDKLEMLISPPLVLAQEHHDFRAEHMTVAETVTETEPTQWIDNPISEDETEETEETEETTDETDDAPTYNVELVQACKTWADGGFAKAYRIVKPDFVIEPHINEVVKEGHICKPYIITPKKGKDYPATLSKVRELVEDVWIEMCDAWTDYTSSQDYDEDTDADLFDDGTNWLDVCNEAVTEETVADMLG